MQRLKTTGGRMSRPTKQGVDYFPLDCNFDTNIELLIAEQGSIALSVIIITWQLIYQDQGYYINFDDDLCLLIRRRIIEDVNDIKKVLQAAIERNIFSKPLADKYQILTSKGIQKRYFVAAKKKKEVLVNKNYLIEGVSVSENSIYSNIDSSRNTTKEEVEEKEEVEGKESLFSILKNKITSENLTQHQDKIIEFFNYRQKERIKNKKQPYKSEKGLNGLFRDIKLCQEQWGDINTCLEIAMEKEWLTPNPDYYKESYFKNKPSNQIRNLTDDELYS